MQMDQGEHMHGLRHHRQVGDAGRYSSKMAEENVEILRGFERATNTRTVPAELLAPGFLMENRVSSVTDYEYHGADGFREWMRDVFEHFADGARYEVEEVIGAGDDFVAAVFCIAGTGAFSDERVEFRWAGVTWFRDGKVTKAVGYPSRRDALLAVGLAT
jgi:ketosteroid isomerase-like protein